LGTDCDLTTKIYNKFIRECNMLFGNKEAEKRLAAEITDLNARLQQREEELAAATLHADRVARSCRLSSES
jgi:hypothetical protein